MNDLRYIFAEPIELDNIGVIYPLNIMKFIKYQHLFGVLSVTNTLLLQQTDIKDIEKREYIENNITNFDVLTSQTDLINTFIDMLALCFDIEQKKKTEKIVVLQNQETNEIFFKVNYIQFEEYLKKWLIDNEKEYNEKYLNNIDIWTNKQIELYKEWDIIGKIDRNNYDYFRNNILKINNIHLPKQAKTAELQKWFDKARKNKNGNSDVDFEDVITTIHCILGISYKELKEETVYQINKTIARINKIKEFDANVTFISVGASDIKLGSFLDHDDDEKEEVLSKDFNEFQRNMGGILKN